MKINNECDAAYSFHINPYTIGRTGTTTTVRSIRVQRSRTAVYLDERNKMLLTRDRIFEIRERLGSQGEVIEQIVRGRADERDALPVPVARAARAARASRSSCRSTNMSI